MSGSVYKGFIGDLILGPVLISEVGPLWIQQTLYLFGVRLDRLGRSDLGKVGCSGRRLLTWFWLTTLTNFAIELVTTNTINCKAYTRSAT